MKYASWPILNLILKLVGCFGFLLGLMSFLNKSWSYLNLIFSHQEIFFAGYFQNLIIMVFCVFIVMKSYWITTLVYGSDPDGPNGDNRSDNNAVWVPPKEPQKLASKPFFSSLFGKKVRMKPKGPQKLATVNFKQRKYKPTKSDPTGIINEQIVQTENTENNRGPQGNSP